MQHPATCSGELIGPAACRSKSRVLTGDHWSRIVAHLHRGEHQAQLADQQREYMEYLRAGSAAMTKNWTNSLQAIREQKQRERREAEELVITEGEERFRKLKDSDEKLREQRIATAQRLLDRVKPGPRRLESAYLEAAVLQTRQQQRDWQAEQRRLDRQRQCAEGCERRAASEQGVADLREMIMVRRRAQDGWKRELAVDIAADRQRMRAQEAESAAEDLRHRRAEEEAIGRQKAENKEQAARKKAAEKERVFEEIRAKREKQAMDSKTDQIEDKVVAIFAQTRDLNFARNHHHRHEIHERNEQRNARMLEVHARSATSEEDAAAEEERRGAAIAEQQERLDQREQADRAAVLRRRAERQQTRADDLVRQQQLGESQLQHRQLAVAERMINEQVATDWLTANRTQQRDQRMQCRRQLLQQMEETKRREAAEKRLWTFANSYETEDAMFFATAQQLMDKANEKKRTLIPLRRVVQDYCRENRVGAGGDNADGLSCVQVEDV